MIRLHDLINSLSHVNAIRPAVDDRWNTYAESAQRWIVVFAAGKSNQALSYDAPGWLQYGLDVLQHLEGELRLFQYDTEASDDPQS